MDDRDEEEARRREVLAALCRKHLSFWLGLTLALLLADRVYHPPPRFTASMLSGLLAWAFLFVAVPVYTAVAALVRLHLGRGFPLPAELAFHRVLAASNLALVGGIAAAVWAGWPWLLLSALPPLLSLATCRVLGSE
ncbi:MAG: hypothetical protein SCH98_05935 [Deferrisomatales bacterium]|nr:hypothetical protein [Deferrisomatales bacterium]